MGKALDWQVYRMDERVRKVGFSSLKWMKKKEEDGSRRRRRRTTKESDTDERRQVEGGRGKTHIYKQR